MNKTLWYLTCVAFAGILAALCYAFYRHDQIITRRPVSAPVLSANLKADIAQSWYTAAPTSTEKIVNDSFETGLMLGWAVRDLGGTRGDILFFAESKRRNDPAAVDRWFNEKRAAK